MQAKGGMAGSAGAQVGTVLDGRYRLEGLIGRGGMGAVYRGTQLAIGRSVAIKLVHRSANLPETLESRFLREAQVMSGLSHPNIVQLFDFGETPENLFLVMELVDGMSLAELLQMKFRLVPDVAAEILRQICAGLLEAHAAGVVHRDMKPGNIMLNIGPDGRLRARVLDFGIAYPRREENVRLTQNGHLCGTPMYMAPEQARGQEAAPAADIYSAGVVFFEMLTGKLPFQGTGMTVLFRHIQEPPPQLDEFTLSGQLPPRLVDLMHRMLDKRPESRPSTGEVADFLESVSPTRPRFPLDSSSPFESALRPPLEPRRASAEERRSNPNVAPVAAHTPFPDGNDEVQSAWDAFMASSNESLENGAWESSFDWEHGAEYEPGVSFNPDQAFEPDPAVNVARPPRPRDALDVSSEFVVPEAVASVKTSDYGAVTGPAPAATVGGPEPVSSKAPTSPGGSSNDDVVELHKPRPTAHALGEGLAPKKRSKRVPKWMFFGVLIVVFVLGAIYLFDVQDAGFAPEADTLSPEEMDEYIKAQEYEGEYDYYPSESETAEPEPSPAKAPKRKKKRRPKKDDVIDLWEGQDKAPTRDVKIQ